MVGFLGPDFQGSGSKGLAPKILISFQGLGCQGLGFQWSSLTGVWFPRVSLKKFQRESKSKVSLIECNFSETFNPFKPYLSLQLNLVQSPFKFHNYTAVFGSIR